MSAASEPRVAAPARERVAVGTIVAKNYLAHARVLARSLRAHHPELTLTVLLVDEVDGCFVPEDEPFRVLGLDALAFPDLRRVLFTHAIRSAASAAKPHLLAHLVDEGHDRVLFLDPDILVLGALDDLLAALETHAILLTPHLTSEPAGPDAIDRELTVLLSGVFNAGVVGVAATPAASAFLGWWAARVREHCRHAVAEGILDDQRWLDLVPSLFGDVHAVREPGAHVGPWNVLEHPVEVDGDRVRVAGRPATLWHFSGFDPGRPGAVTRHASDPTLAQLGPAAELYTGYRDALVDAGGLEARTWPYAFGTFADGLAIPDVARDMLRELGAGASRFGDPFAAGGAGTFRAWTIAPVDAGEPAVPRLWDAVWRRRTDLARAFPDPLGADRVAFTAWCAGQGAREHPDVAALIDAGDRAAGVSAAAPARSRRT